jgi:PhzF family phenazine biosynthesis protein
MPMNTPLMSIPIYTVDAFTREPFRGNPAAVCLLDSARPDAWMQSVAAEMNLSETAFLVRESQNCFALRWMTPTVEVDLCGHATLASAHILFEEGHVDRRRPICFSTHSGMLTASLNDDGMIELDFPAIPTAPLSDPPKKLLEAFDCEVTIASQGKFDFLLEVASETEVRKLQPNFSLLRTLDARGIIVTAIADTGKPYDFISRGFFPGSGIDEDPVTGSAHCMLGPYWMETLGTPIMTGYQASKRGGFVKLKVDGNRVHLFGHAVTTLKGSLKV